MDFSIGSQKLDALQTNLKNVQGKIETSKTAESGFFAQKTQIGDEIKLTKQKIGEYDKQIGSGSDVSEPQGETSEKSEVPQVSSKANSQLEKIKQQREEAQKALEQLNKRNNETNEKIVNELKARNNLETEEKKIDGEIKTEEKTIEEKKQDYENAVNDLKSYRDIVKQDLEQLKSLAESGDVEAFKQLSNEVNKDIINAENQEGNVSHLLKDSGLKADGSTVSLVNDITNFKTEIYALEDSVYLGKEMSKSEQLDLEYSKNRTFDGEYDSINPDKTYIKGNHVNAKIDTTPEGLDFRMIEYKDGSVECDTGQTPFSTNTTLLGSVSDSDITTDKDGNKVLSDKFKRPDGKYEYKGVVLDNNSLNIVNDSLESASQQLDEECMVYKHLTNTIKQHGINGRLTEAEQKFVDNFEKRIARFGLEYQDGKLVPKGN